MSVAVKLSSQLVDEAKVHAQAMSRSATKQIEHWAKIGKLAEENPDLPFEFIKDSLIGLEEKHQGLVSRYEFSK